MRSYFAVVRETTAGTGDLTMRGVATLPTKLVVPAAADSIRSPQVS